MRTSCPTCSCGFKENESLFPELTSAKVQQALGKIKSKKILKNYLDENNIMPKIDKTGVLIFSKGVCKSTQNKVRIKIEQLNLPISSVLQKELELLPASDPDDIPPEKIGAIGSLPWDEPDWLDFSKAWKGIPEESNIDA